MAEWTGFNVMTSTCDWCHKPEQRVVRFREQYICKPCWDEETEWARLSHQERLLKGQDLHARRDSAPPGDTPVRIKGGIYL